MIKTEFYMTRPDGVDLYRTYSDQGFLIQQDQTGKKYSEAVDVEGKYTYTETNEMPESEEISDHEALNILLGRNDHETE